MSDGGGSYLLIDKKRVLIGATIMYVQLQKRSMIGIGVYPAISLADARRVLEEFKE